MLGQISQQESYLNISHEHDAYRADVMPLEEIKPRNWIRGPRSMQDLPKKAVESSVAFSASWPK